MEKRFGTSRPYTVGIEEEYQLVARRLGSWLRRWRP